MPYRNENYSAFYVSKPFNENNPGTNSTHDFVYYNMLRMWKGENLSSKQSFINGVNKPFMGLFLLLWYLFW